MNISQGDHAFFHYGHKWNYVYARTVKPCDIHKVESAFVKSVYMARNRLLFTCKLNFLGTDYMEKPRYLKYPSTIIRAFALSARLPHSRVKIQFPWIAVLASCSFQADEIYGFIAVTRWSIMAGILSLLWYNVLRCLYFVSFLYYKCFVGTGLSWMYYLPLMKAFISSCGSLSGVMSIFFMFVFPCIITL